MSSLYTELFKALIENNLNQNKILVSFDVSISFKTSINDKYFLDLNSFDQIIPRKNIREVAPKFYAKLNEEREIYILSYFQLTALTELFSIEMFKERLILAQDSFRSFYTVKLKEIEEYERELYFLESHIVHNEIYYFPKVEITDHSLTSPFQIKQLENGVTHYTISNHFLSLEVFFNEIFNSKLTESLIIELEIKDNTKRRKSIEILNSFSNYISTLGGELTIQDTALTVEKKVSISEEVFDLFQTYWGNDKTFRKLLFYSEPEVSNELQEISQGAIVQEIIDQIKVGNNGGKPRDIFITAPTGSGKSLIFQLPAFYLSKHGKVTIVISPLIALMKDQVEAIKSDRKYQKVAYLNSELSLTEKDSILNDCRSGNIDILYLSPELFLSYNLSHFIGERELGLFVIDEAHLITTWGRDFRVDYWFLGSEIDKIRRYNEDFKFPILALTATSVYGGTNDMVFDSIDSLYMNNPIMRIGTVKRSDIKFLISNYEDIDSQYEKKKILQSADFIDKLILSGNRKTIVYVPYTTHINKIISAIDETNREKTTKYFSGLDSFEKEANFSDFKSGKKTIMICTKAFGMGIDIPDIEVVYHHAPSGLLPDYTQEIGRLARLPQLEGYAAINYHPKDKRFTKALYGLSSIKRFEIIETIKRIYQLYKKTKTRNLLVSVDDFLHIFDDTSNHEIDQKVLTILMMIEKDYLEKYRFNVLIARPRKLFVKVFAKINSSQLDRFLEKYSFCAIQLDYGLYQGFSVIEVNLESLWSNQFRDISFPKFKRNFYNKSIFHESYGDVTPMLHLKYTINFGIEEAKGKFIRIIDFITEALDNFEEKYFTKEEFEKELSKNLDDRISRKAANFITNNFSNVKIISGNYDSTSFLARRRLNDNISYRKVGAKHHGHFARYKKIFSTLFTKSTSTERYFTAQSDNTITYQKFGYLIEVFELGNFELKGGKNPMIFLRINSPELLLKDSSDQNYQNILLNRTRKRHDISNQIFDHFFSNNFNDETRWNFIEDFFLGNDIDQLLEKYKSTKSNDHNVLDKILDSSSTSTPKPKVKTRKVKRYEIENDKSYYLEDVITIEIDEKPVTKKISSWIAENPILLDQTLNKCNSKVVGEAFQILHSKIQSTDYFIKKVGLDRWINFPGYNKRIKASIPFKDKPVEFYSWWLKNKSEVYINTINLVRLLDKVKLVDSKIISKEHTKYIN